MLKALEQRFHHNPLKAMVELMFTLQLLEDPTLQQVGGAVKEKVAMESSCRNRLLAGVVPVERTHVGAVCEGVSCRRDPQQSGGKV